MPSEDNKRIAKNTLFLYFRMVVITLVSLYTVRVTIEVLGLEDYGIYNLISGFVGFLAILTSTFTTATQRFLSYELGKHDYYNYSRIFSISLIIFTLIAIAVSLIAICVFPWFIYHKLQIPPDRLDVSVSIFYIGVLTFATNLIVIPFSSSIIAHERMSFYAYISIIEVVLKLGVVFLLLNLNGDKLIIYAWLSYGVTALVVLWNILYCKNKFHACKIQKYWDTGFIKQFFSFIGWNSFGAITSIFTVQGLTIILNVFFGPLVNAAKAIADRIFGVVFMLVSNLILASTPQFTKDAATNEYEKLISRFYSISRLSFYLILIIVVPCVISMSFILNTWLGRNSCTNLMVVFSQLTMIGMLFSALEAPISTVVRALGDIRMYQIINGIISLLILPFSVIAFKNGLESYVYCIIQIILAFISLFARIYILHQLLPNLKILYFKKVVRPIGIVTLALSVAVLPTVYFSNISINSLIVMSYSFLISLLIVFLLGCTRQEKGYIMRIISKRIHPSKL